MLMPGAWLLNTSLRPGAATVYAQKRSGAPGATKANYKAEVAAAATDQESSGEHLNMRCLNTVRVTPFRVQPKVDKLQQKANAQQKSAEQH